MFKKSLFTLLITYYSFLIVQAQSQFQWAVGGTGFDYGYSIIQTTDGGYAVAGYTLSFGAGFYDFYIVKLDPMGALQGSKTIGGTNGDAAHSIIQTTDGGYAVAGETTSFGAGSFDFYIVKLDGSGTLQWSKTVGGTGTDRCYSIIQTTDGGYAAAGYTSSFGAGFYDFYIVKLDASGSLQWSKTIGGRNDDEAFSIVQATDGGYVVAGYTESFGVGEDMYIVKLDTSGALQWNRRMGGETANDIAHSIIQTTDGGYAVFGDTQSFGAGLTDFYILKLDASGTPQWSKTIGGTDDDRAWSIIQTTDGGYAAAGYTWSFGAGLTDFYIVKLDASSTLQWSRTIGGANLDYAHSIIQTTDGGYVAAGYSSPFGASGDMYIVKLDASGNTCGNSTSPPSTVTTPTPRVITPIPMVMTPTSTVTTPSSTVSSGGTVTTNCTTVGIQPISNEIPSSYELYQNYPNPFNPTTKINFALPEKAFVKLIIYNALGREITELVNEDLNPGTYSVDWNASNLSSGIYFYSLTALDDRRQTVSYIETKKMILIK